MARPEPSAPTGARLRSLRNAAGMTQAQVAETVGITIESMSRIERGRLQPSADLIRRLAAALEVSPGALFDPTPVELKKPSPRAVERRLLHEVKELPDEMVEDVIRAVRLLLEVGRNTPRTRKTRAK